MKINIFCFFILFSSLLAQAQEKKIKEIYQECMYNSLSDKGRKLKHYSSEFESYLIKNKILTDASASSYYNLFKSLSAKEYNFKPLKYSFIDSINKLEIEKIVPANPECALKIKKHKNFNEFKRKIEEAIPSGSKNFKEGVKRVVEILTVNDFEMDYYKQRVFLFLEMNLI